MAPAGVGSGWFTLKDDEGPTKQHQGSARIARGSSAAPRLGLVGGDVMAGLSVALVLVRWWRAVVFERIARARRESPFERLSLIHI